MRPTGRGALTRLAKLVRLRAHRRALHHQHFDADLVNRAWERLERPGDPPPKDP